MGCCHLYYKESELTRAQALVAHRADVETVILWISVAEGVRLTVAPEIGLQEV